MTTTDNLSIDPVSFILGKGISIKDLSITQQLKILKNTVLLSCSQFELISMPFREHIKEKGLLASTSTPEDFTHDTQCINVCHLIPEQNGYQEIFALTTEGKYLLWKLEFNEETLDRCDVEYLDDTLFADILEQTPDLVFRILRNLRSILGAEVMRKEGQLGRLRVAHNQVEKITGNLSP